VDRQEISQANRLAWNEATVKHRKARKDTLKNAFSKPGYSTLDESITAKLLELELDGKAVAQTSCNNGREVISMVNLGAKSGVGFDISDDAIEEANELAEIAKIDCSFVRTDVYDIHEQYNNTFDLVYISIGALVWLSDLDKFFKVVARILKPGGKLLIYETHPFLYCFPAEDEPEFDSDNPLQVVYSYFRSEPWVTNDGIDYVGGTRYEAKTSYCYTQKMSDIINPIIRNGILIKELLEYDNDIDGTFGQLEKEKKVPLCYMLLGEKS